MYTGWATVSLKLNKATYFSKLSASTGSTNDSDELKLLDNSRSSQQSAGSFPEEDGSGSSSEIGNSSLLGFQII